MIETQHNTVISHQPKLVYNCVVYRMWGHLEEVLEWNQQELVDTWKWEMVTPSNEFDPGEYKFYFQSQRDLVAFLLKWS